MRRLFYAPILVAAGIAVALSTRCGNGSEVLNSFTDDNRNNILVISGTVMKSGNPRSGVLVAAFDTGAIPLWVYSGQAGRAVSDPEGRFAMSLTSRKPYTIFCIDTQTNTGAFQKAVATINSSNVTLGTISLDSLGALSGFLKGDTSGGSGFVVYLLGSPFYALVQGNSEFTITGIPTGEYIVQVFEFIDNASIRTFFPPPALYRRNGVLVAGAKTTELDSILIYKFSEDTSWAPCP